MSKNSKPLDLLLLPPTVYDFREKSMFYGPVSDLIPSSTVFEMYPLGFLTIAAYLQQRGMRVRIVNLALRMINERNFSAPRFLASLRPKAVGIDRTRRWATGHRRRWPVALETTQFECINSLIPLGTRISGQADAITVVNAPTSGLLQTPTLPRAQP